MKVGDVWKISITGAKPNAEVTVGTEQVLPNGQKKVGIRVLGTTDAQGRLTVTDTVLAEHVGNWGMRIKVGGQDMGVAINFAITALATNVPFDSDNILKSGWKIYTVTVYYNDQLKIYSNRSGTVQGKTYEEVRDGIIKQGLGLGSSAPVFLSNVYLYNSIDKTLTPRRTDNHATLEVAQKIAQALGGVVEVSYFGAGGGSPVVEVLGNKAPTSNADLAPTYGIRVGNVLIDAGDFANKIAMYGLEGAIAQLKQGLADEARPGNTGLPDNPGVGTNLGGTTTGAFVLNIASVSARNLKAGDTLTITGRGLRPAMLP